MIILIPNGGIGQRFKDKHYKIPKSLIKVNNTEIIFHLIDNLNITNNISYIYIPYNKEYINYNFETILITRYPNYNFKFYVLEKNTEGAAETIYLALINIKEGIDQPIICIDSDNFYKTDILQQWNGINCIFTFTSNSNKAIFSYVREENNIILDIIEKEKISNNACCGAYGFNSYFELLKYCEKIISNNIKCKNEFYTSCVIKYMVNNGINFTNITIDNKSYFSLGTPDQINQYEYSFLLDLDGTLVNTDNVYIKVWDKILQKYNLRCDELFFNYFIKGKTDINVLTSLVENITNEEIIEISDCKDKYFIEFLENHENILYDDILYFLDNIQNSKIAIITSCNKVAANYILQKYDLFKYIDVVLTSEDVDKHKPHPLPYIKGAHKLNVNLNKCIIFEDSHSGYISAKNANPYKICMYYNGTNNFVKDLNNFYFDNYKKLDINNILLNKTDLKNNIIDKIKKTIDYLPIKHINYNMDSNIKTGYICDINKYSVTFFDNEQQQIIVKTSNEHNELSNIAKKLNMYNNEIYFYNKLSNIININLPKYFGTFNNNNSISFIMEDLYVYNGTFNINLNNDITLLLVIVKNIYNMHNKFFFYNENEIIETMKKLKKVREITFYKELINERFEKFMNKNELILSVNDISILKYIYRNFDNILKKSSNFPLSFCHGDLKSPNIFYKDNKEPYFLDWQYIHLNKGISDIIFLLIESLDFNNITCDIVINYYYSLIKENRYDITYDIFIEDLKNSLCIFPFFVMIWFNSEDQDKLIDKAFPIKFMKNCLKYYKYYLTY
jgi:beta-phosphoglucomutase